MVSMMRCFLKNYSTLKNHNGQVLDLIDRGWVLLQNERIPLLWRTQSHSSYREYIIRQGQQ